MNDLEKLEMRRAQTADNLREYMNPFVKKEKGDIRALQHDEAQLEAAISREASAFLKAHGFKASGDRRKKR